LIHAALVTSANVADSATGLSLPAGGDPAQAPKARDFINRRCRHRGVVDESERAKNRAKSKVRAKIEHSIASHKAPLLSEMRHDFLGK
jgi:IS5 family transposase